MKKEEESCLVCNDTEKESCGLIHRFTVEKEKYYLCVFCNITLGNKDLREIVSFIGDLENLRLFNATKMLIKSIAEDFPKLVVSHQAAYVVQTLAKTDLWNHIKDSIFRKDESKFSEEQLVEIITAAELAKPRTY